jgi:hypothetical protein
MVPEGIRSLVVATSSIHKPVELDHTGAGYETLIKVGYC